MISRSAIGAIIVACCTVVTAPAQSQAAAVPSTESQKTAYLVSIRCYVAGGVAASDPRYSVNAEKLRAGARKSYEFAFKLGRAVGYSDALIGEDLASYGRMMPGAFSRDEALFQRTRAECIKFGLMDG